jgi:DNA polymerase-3 subunit gamma/tau
MDQVVAFCGEEVADEDVQGLLGMVDRRLLLDVLESVQGRDSRQALEVVRRVDDLGHSFRQFCQELVEMYRSVILCKVLDSPGEVLSVTEEELADLQRLAKCAELDDLQRAQTVLMKTEGDLVGSSFPRLTVEMALVRLANLPPARDIAGLVRKLEDIERRLAETGSPVAVAASRSPRPAAVEREVFVPPKKVEAPAPSVVGDQGWQGLVNKVRSRHPMLASLLEHGSLLKQELPQLEVGFAAGSFHLDQVKDGETLEILTKISSEYFAQPVVIRIVPIDVKGGKVPPSLLEERKAQESDRKKRLREDALAHPMVQQAVAVFEGEICEVRPIDKGYV